MFACFGNFIILVGYQNMRTRESLKPKGMKYTNRIQRFKGEILHLEKKVPINLDLKYRTRFIDKRGSVNNLV